jgi:hypothetical protein
MKAITKASVAADNSELFDMVIPTIDGHTEDEEAGAVVFATRTNEDQTVDVLLMFPTKIDEEILELLRSEVVKDELRYKATGIMFNLNTFLNIGRVLAEHHKARIKPPEAVTADGLPHPLLTTGMSKPL